jgi:UTP--glucose-1-phosphate uridylyltransferase
MRYDTTKKINTAIIAAAGKATRMWPASKVLPKELFPLGRIPVIAHIVFELIDAGIENVIIVGAAHNSGFIAQVFDPLRTPPARFASDPLVARFQASLGRCSISIVNQVGNYGNGTPLRIAAEQLEGQSCIYAFGDDVVIGENASRGLIEIYEGTGHPVMAAQEVPPARKSSFGILECERINNAEYVTRVLEKPQPGATASNLASFGRYVVTPPMLEILEGTQPGRDGEVWFTDAVTAHLQEGGPVCAFRLTSGTWYSVGDPAGFSAAVRAATEEQLAATT